MTEEEIVAEYRGLLTKTEQESQADLDKAVLTLSGGALGFSVAFTKDFVGPAQATATGFLLWAWIAWVASSTSVLVSFYTSQLALRKAIKQLDRGVIGMERPGGAWDLSTAILNAVGVVLFLVGLGLMIFFLNRNMPFR